MKKLVECQQALLSLAILVTLTGCQQNSTPPPGDKTPLPAATSTSETVDEPGVVTGGLQSDVQIDKTSYLPNEEIDVMAIAMGLDETAWVGVAGLEASASEPEAFVRKTLVGEGRLVLAAPTEPGEYELRLYGKEGDSKALAGRKLTVTADENPVTEAKLSLNEPTARAGKRVKLDFELPVEAAGSAWVGLVPADTPHEGELTQLDWLSEEKVAGRSRGKAVLRAPKSPGDYDVRICTTNDSGISEELSSLTLTVE